MCKEQEDLIENLVDNILDVLDLGNSDGGYGPPVYALESGEFRKAQLEKINKLVCEYYLRMGQGYNHEMP